MPNSRSARKSLRQSETRKLRNRSTRSELRNTIKNARLAVAGDDSESTAQALKLASKKIDQAASKGIIHKNAAARTKSRLAKLAKQEKAE